MEDGDRAVILAGCIGLRRRFLASRGVEDKDRLPINHHMQ
jgi:hypothetical protein